MKILVIDDDKSRSARLKKYIDSNAIPEIESITLAGYIDESKQYLKSVYYDLLILDVVLPKRSSEAASSENGLTLLDQISRSSFLKKPGAVIGITAHLSDIESYRKEFEKKCLVVTEAPANQDAWKNKIVDFIRYNLASKISRTVQEYQTSIVTVHGIRTFGEWQNRLRSLVHEHTDDISFSNYRYGYFSAISFLVPLLRTREVDRISVHLKSFIKETPSKHVVIFCHSFGTYLVANAIKKITPDIMKIERLTLVFSGSVLPTRHTFDYLKLHGNVRLINECGDRDLPLCVSCAFVLGVGMAGRIGFHGMDDKRLVNRYHNGGHSLYFEGNEFMSQNWLPIIFDDKLNVRNIDNRKPSFVNDAIFEKTIEILGKLKTFLYLSVISYFVLSILS
nr:response regulator [Pseudomonas toyotomiensis]